MRYKNGTVKRSLSNPLTPQAMIVQAILTILAAATASLASVTGPVINKDFPDPGA